MATSGSPSSMAAIRSGGLHRSVSSPSSRSASLRARILTASRRGPTAICGSPNRARTSTSIRSGASRPGRHHRVRLWHQRVRRAHVHALGPDGNVWFTNSRSTASHRSRRPEASPSSARAFVRRQSALRSAQARRHHAGPGRKPLVHGSQQRPHRSDHARRCGDGVQRQHHAGASPFEITAGPDGNLWFTENVGNRIGRITPAGVVTEFSAGISPNARLFGIPQATTAICGSRSNSAIGLDASHPRALLPSSSTASRSMRAPAASWQAPTETCGSRSWTAGSAVSRQACSAM